MAARRCKKVPGKSLMVLPPSAQERKKKTHTQRKTTLVWTLPVFGFLRVVGRGWGLKDRTQGAESTRADGRDPASPASSYWRPSKRAGLPAAAALGRRVTLGGRIVT